MKKQVLACLMAGLMVVLAACGSSGVSSKDASTTTTGSAAAGSATVYKGGREVTEKDKSAPKDAKIGGQFVVGETTGALSPDMISNFGTNAYNRDFTSLLDGDGFIWEDRDHNVDWNAAVVKDHKQTDNSDGSQTYTVTINDGLKWSDGSPVTAKDYVFSVLLWSSKNMADLQADATEGSSFQGFNDFRNQKTKEFSGVHLLSDDTFSFTVDKSELPNYDILIDIAFSPDPMAAEAPGVDIKDDGNGCYFVGLTTDLLRKTMLDPNTGFRYKRPVVCGPYKLKKVDMTTQTIELEINPYYTPTPDGAMPHIADIISKPVAEATMQDEFEKGNISFYTTTRGEKINDLLGKIKSGDLMSDFAIVPDSSVGVWSFQCDFGPGQFPEVRRAFAYCLDRDTMNKQIAGGLGTIQDCLVTAAMPDFQAVKDQLLPNLTHYSLDLDKAKQELINGGWTKNATGGDFKEGVDPIRYKEVKGKLMPLIIKWGYSETPTTTLDSTMVPPECAKIGMKLEGTKMDFGKEISEAQRESGEKNYNVFSFGSSLPEHFAWWYSFDDSPERMGLWNQNYVSDPQLKSISAKMKAVTPGDTKTYRNLFMQFQEAYNKSLPSVPTTTSNDYIFFNPKFKNYVPRPYDNWPAAVLDAYVDDAN